MSSDRFRWVHLEPECGLTRLEGGEGEQSLDLGLVHCLQRAVDKAATKHLSDENIDNHHHPRNDSDHLGPESVAHCGVW